VQTDRASLTNSPPSGGPGGISAGELIARGALLIAVLSAMSRLLGLIRTVVFAQTVGAGCLGTAYVTANTVPNLIYELALGGVRGRGRGEGGDL
jgi:putative peptidoglycan lipid II flippase